MKRFSSYAAIVCALLAILGAALCFFALPLAHSLGNMLDTFGMPVWLFEFWLVFVAIGLSAIVAIWRAVEATQW